jgi:anti-repressor protein
MKSQIQIFNNSQFGDIRTLKTDQGEPSFCLTDVCKQLGLQTNKVKERLSKDGWYSIPVMDSKNRMQDTTFITEPNLYKVIFQSRKPEAEAFTEWVTSEVLPSIRKNGGFISTKSDDSPETIMARALLIADSTIKSQQLILQEQAPKVLFADSVVTSSRSILVGELAKIIAQNGLEIGQNRLFIWLRKHGYLGSHGEYYNLPTQRAMEMDLFEIKKTTINKPDGTVLVTSTTKVTGKGQIYFVNKFLHPKNMEAQS